jgi:hypothetical protein
MREINGHKVNPANDKISVVCYDGPGAGGACHEYQVIVTEGKSFPIVFQNGPIAEAGVNGLTHEALLAIIVDRLEHFQKGPYACRENALALTHIQDAQHWLHHRTKARMDRGVEGTHTV